MWRVSQRRWKMEEKGGGGCDVSEHVNDNWTFQKRAPPQLGGAVCDAHRHHMEEWATVL